MCSTYQDVRNLLAKGKLNKAIECALAIAEQTQENRHTQNLISISARNHRNEDSHNKGILGQNDYNIESARITFSLQSELDEMEEDYPNLHLSSYEDAIKNRSEVTGNDNIVIQDIGSSQINFGKKDEKIKQKILFLAANPSNQASLQTDKEYRIISERMRRNEHYELLHPQFALTIENLVIAMNQKPHIVHFAGHGEQSGIIITNDQNNPQLMPTRALSRLFRQHKEGIQMILLNACYSESQAKVLSELGMYVIGMSKAAEDDAALDFASGVYIGLSEGKDVETAYDDAMIIIEVKHPQFADLPKVWKDGVLLDI
ncbi:MAG: CHAT domain-containing protein [Chitinophagales bacterium]